MVLHEANPDNRQTALRRGALALAALALLASGQVAPPALAAEPAAVVVERDGPARPRLEPYDEIAVGDVVLLAEKTRLTFIHYGTCEEVTVTAGEVHMSAHRFLVKGGRIESQRRTECPRRVRPGRIGADAEAAGVRGAETATAPDPALTPRTGRRPVFMLPASLRTGDGAAPPVGHLLVAHLPVGEARRDLVPVGPGALGLLEDADPLPEEEAYILVLEGADGTRREYAFLAGRSLGAGALVRLDDAE